MTRQVDPARLEDVLAGYDAKAEPRSRFETRSHGTSWESPGFALKGPFEGDIEPYEGYIYAFSEYTVGASTTLQGS